MERLFLVLIVTSAVLMQRASAQFNNLITSDTPAYEDTPHGHIPGTYYELLNDEHVWDSWTVFEVSAYSDHRCKTQAVQETGPLGSVNENMIVLATSLLSDIKFPNAEVKALTDNNEDSYWIANCRLLLGGCARHSQKIMLNLTLLRNVYDDVPEVALDDHDPIKCWRIKQAGDRFRVEEKNTN